MEKNIELSLYYHREQQNIIYSFVFLSVQRKLPEPPYEVSIAGKAPRGRKLQPTENTCAA